jgi:membrane-bound metal-dependent hydrolase YbcI (DUF457 family)
VSWATHDLEPYFLQRHFPAKWRVSFVALLLGSWGPDVFTKWFVYGINVLGHEFKADNPASFHRDWPGAGFTHSLAFGVALGALVFAVSRHRGWALGLMLGTSAHVFSDTLDSYGAMLWFPFSTDRVHLDAWRYTSFEGRFGDAASYFSALGFAWDGFWLAMTLLNYQVLSSTYFASVVAPADPFWRLAGRFLPGPALVALYRGAFFYGSGRWVAWLIWAHVVNAYEFDLRWTGPSWAPMLGG